MSNTAGSEQPHQPQFIFFCTENCPSSFTQPFTQCQCSDAALLCPISIMFSFPNMPKRYAPKNIIDTRFPKTIPIDLPVSHLSFTYPPHMRQVIRQISRKIRRLLPPTFTRIRSIKIIVTKKPLPRMFDARRWRPYQSNSARLWRQSRTSSMVCKF